ncbi:MAG TPA: DMT family transporter [Xanthobacteraceae bacterium]|jgi:drug/metabolite transporter (DMT)-like permease|nr:DMT family transporter [Xanthobacteraceae bacterium]
MAAGGLWAVFTVIAAAAQTARNAMQRELTVKLGTAGATHVRFLFGFPFAVLFLIGVAVVIEAPLPRPSLVFAPWVFVGALAQIAATALMLAAMSERSFVAAVAYIKTEPIQIALFGLIVLGDMLTLQTLIATLIATAGVVVMSIKRGAQGEGSARATLMGLGAGASFALSAIGYRGAILALGHPSFVMAATFTLTMGLLLQAGLLTGYLAWRDRKVLSAIMLNWRPSVFAGAMGALASEFWFLGFAITTAANVRTLGLVEVLFAQMVSRFIFKHHLSKQELIGVILIVTGVGLLVAVI